MFACSTLVLNIGWTYCIYSMVSWKIYTRYDSKNSSAFQVWFRLWKVSFPLGEYTVYHLQDRAAQPLKPPLYQAYYFQKGSQWIMEQNTISLFPLHLSNPFVQPSWGHMSFYFNYSQLVFKGIVSLFKSLWYGCPLAPEWKYTAPKPFF